MKKIIILVLLILCASSVSAVLDVELSGINVTLLNQQPDPVSPGDIVEVRFSVERIIGPEPIANLQFEIIPQFPFSLLDGDDGVRSVNIIRPKAQHDAGVLLYYRLKVADDATEGLQDLLLEYGKGTGKTRLDPFNIRVQSQDAVIAVENMATYPEVVQPGQPFEVQLTVRNHAQSLLRNVRAILGLGATSFSPYHASNEQTLRSIQAGANHTFLFPLIVDGDANTKVHRLPLFLQYEDETGTIFSRNSTVSVIVNEKPSFLLSIEESSAVESGSTGTIIVSLSNIGTSDLKFVVFNILESPDYEVISTPQVYVGNVEPDDFETAEFNLYLNKHVEESVPLLLSMSFRDNFNAQFTEEVPLLLKLYSKEEISTYQLKEVPSKLGGIIGFLIIILVVAFVLFMILDWRRNPMQRYKKILWLIVILTGIGAILYYYMARRKQS